VQFDGRNQRARKRGPVVIVDRRIQAGVDTVIGDSISRTLPVKHLIDRATSGLL
jgi:hypothetical protein